MYRASIQKHARTRHLTRQDASPGSQSMYPSLLVRGSVKKSTLASQSLPIPDDMATDKDAIIDTNVSAYSVVDTLHEVQIGNLSDASTSTEIDSDAATNHSDAMHKLPSNTTLSDYPEMLSDTSTFAVYDADADAESESDVSCVAFKVVDGLWDEGRGFWVHDFALVRQFEEEKRMADMTGGGEECFAAEVEKDEEDVSEAMKAWIDSRFPDEHEEDFEEDKEEDLAEED
ncbi:hypothetical protein BOTNAR_0009g00460 [Botryotinia narcissicola]|uniref:Uncharacterized protein n=1 Tax=Botryotinia narcissicola TaxID=278944 RepID=A0A4Z1J7A7_9HELO|nr:hypothetical protein BOTNAR_0009g00460 [Botryotinia narcissicola]